MLSILVRKLVSRSSFISKMNSNITSSIERAKRVQDNVLQQNYKIQLQAKIRKKVDIESSIDELEKQLMQEIARSLRKSEDKVKFFIEKAQSRYKQLSQVKQQDKQNKRKQIKEYNMLVDLCVKARWEFLIHRQSCGFTIRNHQMVHSLYVIPPKLSL